jgi:hypothetical protein
MQKIHLWRAVDSDGSLGMALRREFYVFFAREKVRLSLNFCLDA